MSMRALAKAISCVIMGTALLALLSCSEGSVGLSRFEGLEQRVNRYYQVEQSGDWEAAYSFRTPAYRQSVPKEKFVNEMKRDDAGWKLLSFKITSVKEKEGKVNLKVTFVVIPPASHFQGQIPAGAKIGELEIEDDSIWVRMNGEWYCYTPGTRVHLPMNAPLVYQ